MSLGTLKLSLAKQTLKDSLIDYETLYFNITSARIKEEITIKFGKFSVLQKLVNTVKLQMRLAGFNIFHQFLQAKKVVFLDFSVIK